MRTLALVSLLLCGCNVWLTDDVDLTLDFHPLTGPSNVMHEPYVAGSRFNIHVHTNRSTESMRGWRLESSDPSILRIEKLSYDDDERLSAHVRTFREGDVRLRVVDDGGDVRHERVVPVRQPDRVELLAHGMLLIGKDEAEARVGELRVRVGGKATYLARYYKDGQQLFGNGALFAESTPEVEVGVVRSFIFEDRDWLQVSPNKVGDFDVLLEVAGQRVNGFPVAAVPDYDVVEVRIIGVDESRAKKGEELVALAQAYDAKGRHVYGVEYNWKLDGFREDGLGDLYRYKYDPDRPRTLEAQFASMSASAIIRGKGFVSSTNHVGCSAAPGRATGGAFAVLLLLGAIAVRARRRA